MDRFIGTVCDASGNPLSGVTVTVVKAGTAVNAALYSDDGITTMANPFTNDANGTFEFYAPNGRYDLTFAKSGSSWVAADSTDLLMFDPSDDGGYARLRDDFLGLFESGSDVLSGGVHWRTGSGSITRVAGTTTYKNGWLDVLEAAGAQGSLFVADDANALALLFVPTTDVMVFECKVEKVGDAVAGTRRIGLGSAALAAGDPTDGIYIRQIDANNAFLVTRNGAVESTQDLGVTLNDPKKIRVTITTTSVRAFVDDVAKTPITTNIPTAILGLSIGGGATASAGGLRVDYVEVHAKR